MLDNVLVDACRGTIFVIYSTAGSPAIAPIATPILLDQVRASKPNITPIAPSTRTFIGFGGSSFFGKRHPRDVGAPEIERFLTNLAVAQTVAASTQTQPLRAPFSLQAGADDRVARALLYALVA